MAFLLLPLEADFGFSQVERALAFRPDRLAVSKSATGSKMTFDCHWRPILAERGLPLEVDFA